MSARGWLAVGERASTSSAAFGAAVRRGDWQAAVAVATGQAAEGIDAIDVCLLDAPGGEDAAMAELLPRLHAATELPLWLDSLRTSALATGLDLLGGDATLNSLAWNDERGPRLQLARRHRCPVVALCLDADGPGRTAAQKLLIARRLVGELLDAGLPPHDIICDVAVLPLRADPDAGRQAVEAVAAVRDEFPGVRPLVGVYNLVYGLAEPARGATAAAFLRDALAAGAQAAFVRPGALPAAA